MNTKTSSTHQCSVPDCGLEVPVRMLMCKSHWAMVPKPVQWTVLSAFTRWQTGKLPIADLRAVQEVATAAVVAVRGGVE